MRKSSSAKTRVPKTIRSHEAAGGKRRVDEDGNPFRLLALSPNRARVEFLDGEPLISRSQAKRVLARVELFRTVVFDFSGVSTIGQAFADEIFRVFAHAHPEIQLQFIHANAAVKQMISRARSAEARQGPLGKDAAPAGSSSHRSRGNLLQREPMRKKLTDTNPYLRDPAMRERMVIRSVVTSSAVDGIRVSFRRSGRTCRKASGRQNQLSRKKR